LVATRDEIEVEISGAKSIRERLGHRPAVTGQPCRTAGRNPCLEPAARLRDDPSLEVGSTKLALTLRHPGKICNEQNGQDAIEELLASASNCVIYDEHDDSADDSDQDAVKIHAGDSRHAKRLK